MAKELGRNSGVNVGVPQAAGSYEDGPHLAVIAATHEFGSASQNIPERSFLRVPLRGAKDELGQIISRQLPMVVEGQLSMVQLMNQLGARAASISQEAISAGIPPANAPATVAKKGSSTPLVDTGRLRQAITHVVDDE
jgi:phage gpG-like protein